MPRVNDEATTAGKQSDRGSACEPVRTGEGSQDPPSAPLEESGEFILEEAGYGYGV